MDVLQEAFSRLDLFQVGRALGVELKMGLQSRPGGEKESKESFSVFSGRDGKPAFKDHARGDGGGVWQLVRVLRPEWSKKQTAEWLIEQAGLDPADGRKNNRQLREDLTRKRTEASRKHFGELSALDVLPPLVEMSATVRERYMTGWKGYEEKRMERLATERGWPVEWVQDLVKLGRISDPVLPWHTVGGKGAQRGTAFLVQRPDRDGKLVSVGYHQRFRTKEGRAWCFCPYITQKDARSDYQRAMAEEKKTVQPFPFVMGNWRAPLWVILEGQWDAATFWYLWNLKPDPAPVFVVGIRGAQGVGVFLAAWARFLQKVSPRVWCITDNDTAGRSWAIVEKDQAKFKPHTFLDRLRHWAGTEPAHSMIPASMGKDLNDFLQSLACPDAAAAHLKMNYMKAFPGDCDE